MKCSPLSPHRTSDARLFCANSNRDPHGGHRLQMGFMRIVEGDLKATLRGRVRGWRERVWHRLLHGWLVDPRVLARARAGPGAGRPPGCRLGSRPRKDLAPQLDGPEAELKDQRSRSTPPRNRGRAWRPRKGYRTPRTSSGAAVGQDARDGRAGLVSGLAIGRRCRRHANDDRSRFGTEARNLNLLPQIRSLA